MLVRHVYILSSWYGVIIFFLKNTFFIFFLLEMYAFPTKNQLLELWFPNSTCSTP